MERQLALPAAKTSPRSVVDLRGCVHELVQGLGFFPEMRGFWVPACWVREPAALDVQLLVLMLLMIDTTLLLMVVAMCENDDDDDDVTMMHWW